MNICRPQCLPYILHVLKSWEGNPTNAKIKDLYLSLYDLSPIKPYQTLISELLPEVLTYLGNLSELNEC